VSRAVVAFPGRGAYGPSSLGSLTPGHAWVRRADEMRGQAGLPPLSSIDAAERFDPEVHLRPTNGWPLVFLCSLLDAERIADDHEVVVVVASSTGWYTALAASGVLGFDDAFRLVSEMAAAAEAPLPHAAQPAESSIPSRTNRGSPFRRGSPVCATRSSTATGAPRSPSISAGSPSSAGPQPESTHSPAACRP